MSKARDAKRIHFISLFEHPEYQDRFLSSVRGNNDWQEIVPRLESMLSDRGKHRLPQIELAMIDDVIIGFFALTDKEILKDEYTYSPWLRLLLILDDHRGKGYSPYLLAEAQRLTRALGFSHLYVAAEQIQYFEKYGYEEIGLALYTWGAPTKIYRYTLLHDLIPKHGSDMSTMNALWKLTPQELGTIIPELLVFFQHCQDSVPRKLTDLFVQHSEQVVPCLDPILQENQMHAMWKYGILTQLLSALDRQSYMETLSQSLYRIAYHPTSAERHAKCDEQAKRLLSF